MITTPPSRQVLGQAFVLSLFIATVTALPRQDAHSIVGQPISFASQISGTLSSSEETDVSVQDESPSVRQNQFDDDFHPFLDVEDLSAEYEYDYRSNDSDEDNDNERVRRSLMGRGSTARGGGRRGGGDISRRRDGNRNDYGGGSHYTWTPKRAPISAPEVTKSNAPPSPVTDTSSAKAKKEKKEKRKKKKNGPKKNKDRNGLTKPLRQEIAEYALKHGLGAANEQYKSKVGRMLPEKVIDKWVQRLRKKQNKHASE